MSEPNRTILKKVKGYGPTWFKPSKESKKSKAEKNVKTKAADDEASKNAIPESKEVKAALRAQLDRVIEDRQKVLAAADKEYDKAAEIARKEYGKAEEIARKECDKEMDIATKEYGKVIKAAEGDRLNAEDIADEEWKKVTDTAKKDCLKAMADIRSVHRLKV